MISHEKATAKKGQKGKATPEPKKKKKKKSVSKKKVPDDNKKFKSKESQPDEDIEDCILLKHRVDDEDEIEVLVKWLLTKEKEWMKLYDMWADYPIRVCEYRREKQIKGKEWHNPSLDKMEYFVRILSHDNPSKGRKKEDYHFCVLANNGYVVEDMLYKELFIDAPHLLEDYVANNSL